MSDQRFFFGFWDVIDVLIVGYLLYALYRLLRGSLAVNIMIGMTILYVIWWVVDALEMSLLNSVLSQFFNIGLIILIIIFQPEVRRFLLVLGESTFGQRNHLIKHIFSSGQETNSVPSRLTFLLIDAIEELQKRHVGAIIVLAKPGQLGYFDASGISLNADISMELLVGLFQKSNPLHDGAVLISKDKIQKASVILPISEAQDLPNQFGLRHRAALGATESYGVAVVVISEETGGISWIEAGKIKDVDVKELNTLLPLWV